MILVDASALIEYDLGTGSAVHLRLADRIVSDAVVATTEPVNMEVISGARDDAAEDRLRRMLRHFVILGFDPVIDFDGASRIYRLCRSAGVTPRGLIDCMISSVAMRHHAALLAQDADFARIAEVVPLILDPATPTS